MLGLGVSTLCSQKSEYNLEMAIRIHGFCVCGSLSMDLTHLGLCSAVVPVTENKYVCACSVAQSCVILCDSMDYSPPGSFVLGIIPAKILASPRIEPESSVTLALVGGFLASEPPGKPPYISGPVQFKPVLFKSQL